jgi:hypothetical protein
MNEDDEVPSVTQIRACIADMAAAAGDLPACPSWCQLLAGHPPEGSFEPEIRVHYGGVNHLTLTQGTDVELEICSTEEFHNGRVSAVGLPVLRVVANDVELSPEAVRTLASALLIAGRRLDVARKEVSQ